MAPRCGQPSWDYWSGADVSISSRHHRALSQPPTITRSFSLGLASSLPTHHQSALSANSHRSVRWWLHWYALLPANSYQSFYTPSSHPLIPPRNLHHKKNLYPPPFHCRLFHLLLSLSLLSLCLILVCASACHIKGEPGVTEPQAWNINAANCVAVWEINPLKIAPYTSWTHHQPLIRIVAYRIFLQPFMHFILHSMPSLKKSMLCHSLFLTQVYPWSISVKTNIL